MTCHHCVRHVTTELQAIPGVTEVEVELRSGGSSSVVVTCDGPLADADVAAAVEEAGYQMAPPGSLL